MSWAGAARIRVDRTGQVNCHYRGGLWLRAWARDVRHDRWLPAGIVFANAGTGEFAPLGQITEAHFDKQFDVNVKGLLFTVQKALPLLQPGGSIV